MILERALMVDVEDGSNPMSATCAKTVGLGFGGYVLRIREYEMVVEERGTRNYYEKREEGREGMVT